MIICKKCAREFSSKKELELHMDTAHSKIGIKSKKAKDPKIEQTEPKAE